MSNIYFPRVGFNTPVSKFSIQISKIAALKYEDRLYSMPYGSISALDKFMELLWVTRSQYGIDCVYYYANGLLFCTGTNPIGRKLPQDRLKLLMSGVTSLINAHKAELKRDGFTSDAACTISDYLCAGIKEIEEEVNGV